jgi:hypothetical protein
MRPAVNDARRREPKAGPCSYSTEWIGSLLGRINSTAPQMSEAGAPKLRHLLVRIVATMTPHDNDSTRAIADACTPKCDALPQGKFVAGRGRPEPNRRGISASKS